MSDSAPQHRPSTIGVIVYWLVLVACGLAPWLCHFAIGWWAGLLVFFPLAALYQRLFVPEGSICMGLFFSLALASFMGLLLLDGALLLRYLLVPAH